MRASVMRLGMLKRRPRHLAMEIDRRSRLAKRRAITRPALRAGRFRHKPGPLRAVELRLIHRRAVFEYLRSIATDGVRRRRVVALFHHSLTYTGAVVAEHRLFIRSTLSQLCAEHIGRAVVCDPAFGEPLRDYVNLYTAYFRLFCETYTQPADSDDPCRALLPFLKPQVVEQRRAILALAARS